MPKGRNYSRGRNTKRKSSIRKSSPRTGKRLGSGIKKASRVHFMAGTQL